MALLVRDPGEVVYFTDCVKDPKGDPGDAQARMRAGVLRETGLRVGEFVRVRYPGDGSDVAMTLVSMLHANEPTTARAPRGNTLILNNASPRKETFSLARPGQQLVNGRRVCALVVNGRSLVVSTYSPGFFSLAHRLGLVPELRVFEAGEVLYQWAVPEGLMSLEQADEMHADPFRGASYIPWLAGAILADGFEMPHSMGDMGEPAAPQGVVARLDTEAFGPNLYLDTLTTDLDVDWESGRDTVSLWNGEPLTCYPSFAQIPPDQLGAAPASSRFGNQRFVMVAVQGGSAYTELLRRGLTVRLGAKVLHDDALRGLVAAR